MLNFRKRIFLFLTIIATVLCLVSCADASNTVRISFDKEEYTVRLHEDLDITPIIKAASSVNVKDINVAYELDEEYLRYEDGIFTTLKEGQTTVKVYWTDKDVVFDKVVINIIKPALPEFDSSAPKTMLKNAEQTLEVALYKNYTEATVEVKSLNPEIVSYVDGKIKALEIGTAKFEAVVKDYEEEKTINFSIEVVNSDFAVTYILNGGTNDESNPVGFNAVLDLPIQLANPLKAGYDFAGWTIHDEEKDEDVKVTEIAVGTVQDVELTAHWDLVTYDVTYNLDGGVAGENAPATYDVEHQPVALVNPTRTGYEFAGWKLDDKVVTEIATGTTGDLELVATWKPLSYGITYNTDGGNLPEGAETSFEFGKGLATLPTPTKDGFNFLGWFDGEVKVESIAADKADKVELTAHWEAVAEPTEYDITWNLNGGSWSKTVSTGYATYEDVVADVLKDFGMTTVSVWASGVDDKFRENMTKWGALLDYFIAVRGDADGFLAQIRSCRAGTDLTGDVNPYVVTGEFKAFVEKGVITYTSAAITSCDYSVEATRELIWNYITKGSSETQTVEHPDKYQVETGVATLPTPLKDDDTFAGWYVEDVKWESIPAGTKGTVTLKARWASEGPVNPVNHDITYNLDGGENATDAPTTYIEGVGLAQLPTPTKEGFKFLGWFVGNVKVESISTEEKADVELTAHWEAEAPVPVDYTIAYNLDGGTWPAKQFTTRTEVMRALLDDFAKYFGHATEISITEDLELTDEGKPRHVSDFMGASYSYVDIVDAFFTTAPYQAKWSWVRQILVDAGANLSTTTLIRANIHSFIYQTVWPSWPYSSNFSTYDFDSFKEKLPAPTPVEPVKVYTSGTAMELPVPAKEGFDFAGWYNGTVLVPSITTGQTGNLELTAHWRAASGEAGVIKVGAEETYKTINDAMAVAMPGDVIKVAAGTYEGGTINVANVKVLGPNANVDPNKQTRADEAIFTSDLVVAADDVEVNGIELTGKGRIVGSEAGVKNTNILCVYSYQSTVNPEAAASSTAPIVFLATGDAKFVNLSLSYLKYEGSTGRPMIFYGGNVENFSVKYSTFIGTRSNFNDGIKLDNTGFGMNGNIDIIGNHFENYAQYVIWFRAYAEGTYNIQNNEFKNVGSTAASHAAATFSKDGYKGAADGKVTINFQYNVVDNSYMLFRLDASTVNQASFEAHVNYNKLSNCAADYYVKNSMAFNIDAENNWYDQAPVAAKFLKADYEPYYANVDDVPTFGQPLNFFGIVYELNGGSLPAGTTASFDGTVGLATLPTPTYEGHIFLGWYVEDVKWESIPAGTNNKVTLTAHWREDALYVGTGTEDYLYATIAAAVEAAKEGDKIIVLAGEYTEELTIAKANLTIAGPNAGVNANTGTRAAEAVLKGSIKVTANYVTIDGLAFTGAATIKNTTANGLKGFKFVNNKVYDTADCQTAWQETTGFNDGFIVFIATSNGQEVSNFLFQNNRFENVSAGNIILTRSMNISFDGNVFKDFDRDAIRFDTGGYNYGVLSFTNNTFEQSVAGNGNHAVYFRIYGGPNVNDTQIIIKSNTFTKIGNSTTSSLYNGAIGARNYQEMGADIQITNNVFDHCVNDVRIRNNGEAANHAKSVWACNIENNQFLGLPTSYFYANWNASDGATTNPENTVFGANYYEDNEGNVISDLAPHAALFKNCKSIGTTLAAKPASVVADAVAFYTIGYDLDGGTAKGTFVSAYSSLLKDVIAVPTPTKANHEFLGWELNGVLVTEIPATTRGDVVLTAKWKVLEGEIYELTFNTDKGIWPTRDSEDREEIVNELFKDLHEWSGSSATLEAYTASTKATIDANTDIKLRNTTLGDHAAEDGSTEFFLNIPKYYSKWAAFFRVFDKAMLAVNQAQSFYTDTFATMVRMSQFINWTATGQGYFASSLPAMCTTLQLEKEHPTSYRGGQTLVLPVLTMDNGLVFLGWYENPEFTGNPVTSITPIDTGNKVYYAKWEAEVVATEIQINKISEITRYATHQLVWSFVPTNTTDQTVEFFSSNEAVATISPLKGLITAVDNGVTTITMKVYGNRTLDVQFELTVYSPDHMEGSYETNSYVVKNESVNLVAKIVGKSTGTVVWTSSDDSIATVENGVVTGVKAGQVTITAKDSTNENVKLEFIVMVYDEAPTGVLEMAAKANNSKTTQVAQLGIGAGVPVYYMDIYGSVSDLLFKPYVVDTSLYTSTPTLDNHSGTRTGAVEFICVHYTGNMSATAGAGANARYFVQQSTSSSIHYVTGNDGIFACYDESLVAWHAGDGTGTEFVWDASGVMVQATDPERPVVTITENSKFAINGVETNLTCPSGNNKNGEFITPKDSEYLTCLGPAVKVVDGQYYIGTTWWCNSQVAAGRVCSHGGNLNSIGIESAVNKGTDLWLTWQMTAQLVARLIEKYDLDISRVVGHNFFNAKDCPQPLLENDCELWWQFIDMVKAEQQLITTGKDYTMTCVSNNPDLVDNQGRVVKFPEFATCVTYTVTFTKGDDVKTITLSSLIPGIYEK